MKTNQALFNAYQKNGYSDNIMKWIFVLPKQHFLAVKYFKITISIQKVWLFLTCTVDKSLIFNDTMKLQKPIPTPFYIE